jgi:hypothetical protein
MSMGLKQVRVELWPLAADRAGIWLVSGTEGAWEPALPIDSDETIHDAVESLLWTHKRAANDTLDLLTIHSTSWRDDGPDMVVTYLAALRIQDNVLDEWPDAMPVTTEVINVVGKPYVHASTEAPQPRQIDVLDHGLRHFAYLDQTNTTFSRDLTLPWHRHLSKLQPVLAQLYLTA